ncbi:hypothetical protein [Tenggerimyces flavus]|uniref:Uncharacterized protein n=1 Tax=Tenggerimyces flavus TaxID=1708749 RepID=A0ABV7Y7T1_9ACTN|nr:hypothetical protein [Tenggerimyces flavus]MBM7791102.1 hypothetical protein [Tenggerimyces flavus]
MVTLLAAERDPSVWVGPGLLGFVVIMGLVVATILLWRNMNKQLKKVTFDDGSEPAAPTPTEPAEPQPNGKPSPS